MSHQLTLFSCLIRLFNFEHVETALSDRPELVQLWREHGEADELPCFQVEIGARADGPTAYSVKHMSIQSFLMASAFYRFAGQRDTTDVNAAIPFFEQLTGLTKDLFHWFVDRLSLLQTS